MPFPRLAPWRYSGKTTEAAWPLLNRVGRVVVCGMISTYTGDEWGAVDGLPLYNTQILSKELKIQVCLCFHVFFVFVCV